MKTLLAVVVLAVNASAADFDGGVDVSAALSAAKAAAASAPGYQRPEGSRRPDRYSHDVDCKELTVPVGELQAARSISLESHDLDCDDAYNTCTNGSRSGNYHSGSALVVVKGTAEAKPWETAKFRVCMEGTMIDVDAKKDNPFALTVVEAGSAANDWTWTVQAGARVAAKADPAGVRASLIVGAEPFPGSALLFHDQWSEHYAGGSVEVRFEIKRDRNNLQDETLYANTLTFPTAASYEASIKGLVFKPGENYYIAYSIRRSGEKEFGEKQRFDSQPNFVYQPSR